MITTLARVQCANGKAHYWLIGPPEGPESKGFCSRCGGVRLFKNHFEIDFGDSDAASKSHRMPELLVSEPWVRRRRNQPESWTEPNETLSEGGA